ncbi:hypothetical protein M5689_008853 [Euphorbia peplus]|nr:hypothetical protein M5689_008853 [Euphorbia peplus]
MDSKIVEMCKKLSLSEQEKDITEVEELEAECKNIPNPRRYAVLCRLLTRKPLNLRVLHGALSGMWKIVDDFKLEETGKGTFMCIFHTLRDKAWVMQNGPWQFDRQLILMYEIQGFEQPSEIEINHCWFWVRIYDLPLDRRDECSIYKVAKKIGRVCAIQEEDIGTLGSSVRVRVEVDINKQLVRGTYIRNSAKKACWVYFRCEKLPNFCYLCGFIGHVMDDCVTNDQEDVGENWPFPPSLRASPFKRKSYGSWKDQGKAGTGNESMLSRSVTSNEPNNVRRKLQLVPIDKGTSDLVQCNSPIASNPNKAEMKESSADADAIKNISDKETTDFLQGNSRMVTVG